MVLAGIGFLPFGDIAKVLRKGDDLVDAGTDAARLADDVPSGPTISGGGSGSTRGTRNPVVRAAAERGRKAHRTTGRRLAVGPTWKFGFRVVVELMRWSGIRGPFESLSRTIREQFVAEKAWSSASARSWRR